MKFVYEKIIESIFPHIFFKNQIQLNLRINERSQISGEQKDQIKKVYLYSRILIKER